MSGLDTIEEAVTTEECERVFHAVPYLTGLSEADIEALAPLARIREFRAGTVLFYEDDITDAVYFLSSGAIEVFKSDNSGKKLPLTILRDNGVLGEMGLINDAPRTATARALTPVRAILFKSAEFHEARERGSLGVNHLVFAFARVLAHRLTTMDETLFALFQYDQEQNDPDGLGALRSEILSNWKA